MTPVLFKRWLPLFDPNKEKLGAGPLWVRLLELPLQFWLEDVFRGVGDDLGLYLDHDKPYIESENTAITRISVHLDMREDFWKVFICNIEGSSDGRS